ncbi:outer membrane beta-barrel protein [Formosa sp. PL04]|uniref:outer membrane beta-barrel protein n=1 Tax=Formosa sp. PL04 TaxID=3081755 RepID=UPI0029829E00|nr:outer membrane beta-barrel protein [Formosa sp. PL04]MDW5287414.1 outer membrane beta-barrel protein [Formosa sp. PL04]
MKKIFTFALIFASISIYAQDIVVVEEVESEKIIDLKKFSFSGSVDTYFRTNIGAPDIEGVAPGTSFANLPGFALGMANVIASYDGEKVGFVADLVYGPRGTDATFMSPMYSATGDIINQLYVYWNVTDNVTVTMGNFNTFLGYEVISPVGNFNYSTSYLFSYGPFSHTGLKADFTLSDDFSLMLGVFNQTDMTEFNPTGKYSFGAQLGYKGQYLNFLTDDGAFEIDYTGGFNLTDTFYLGLNAAYYDNDGNNFAGVDLYPQYTFSDSFALGLRAEYFTQEGEMSAIGTPVGPDMDSNVFAATLTGSFSIKSLTIKPELRIDSASEDSAYFLNDDMMPTKSLSSFVLAAIYAF